MNTKNWIFRFLWNFRQKLRPKLKKMTFFIWKKKTKGGGDVLPGSEPIKIDRQGRAFLMTKQLCGKIFPQGPDERTRPMGEAPLKKKPYLYNIFPHICSSFSSYCSCRNTFDNRVGTFLNCKSWRRCLSPTWTSWVWARWWSRSPACPQSSWPPLCSAG